MPIYDYRCVDCDERFEVSRPMGSASDPCCPSCGKQAKRVFTPVGVAFKGSGFHNTDYKQKPREESNPTPSCPASSGEKGSGCTGCPAAS
jgi:putative FmdB family regulatory protein